MSETADRNSHKTRSVCNRLKCIWNLMLSCYVSPRISKEESFKHYTLFERSPRKKKTKLKKRIFQEKRSALIIKIWFNCRNGGSQWKSTFHRREPFDFNCKRFCHLLYPLKKPSFNCEDRMFWMREKKVSLSVLLKKIQPKKILGKKIKLTNSFFVLIKHCLPNRE